MLLEHNGVKEVMQKMKKGRDKGTNRNRLMRGPVLRVYYEQIRESNLVLLRHKTATGNWSERRKRRNEGSLAIPRHWAISRLL